jgi:hypothetical protein
MKRSWNLTPPQQTFRTEPCLIFAPRAWLKLVYFCHAGDTEIGGFGLSAPNNLLYIEDFVTVRQQATSVTVRFLDDAVADYFDACCDRGLTPARCGRIWCHTHPGDSAQPSTTDERTFVRSFGNCDWAVMMILAHSGDTYARLAFGTGPTAEILIPVRVDWSAWAQALALETASLDAQVAAWREEFATNVLKGRLFPFAHSEPDLSSSPMLQAAQVPWWEDEAWPMLEESIDHDFPLEVTHDDARDHPHGAGA